MPTILPPKKDVALALLERASVFVHLDPRDPSVQVPSWFKRQPQLVLQVGLNMLVRIPDLDVGEEAIACTLSFNRAPHYCYVPWRAVYALVGEDGRGMVWPEDIPPEVPAQSSAQQMGSSPLSQRPRLRSVPRDSAPTDPAPIGAAPTASGPVDSLLADSRLNDSLAADSAGRVERGPSTAPAGPPSAGSASRRARFRVAGERDSASGSNARSRSILPPAPDSSAPAHGHLRDAGSASASGEDNPPILALSGSKRRRANAERKAGDSRAPLAPNSVAPGSGLPGSQLAGSQLAGSGLAGSVAPIAAPQGSGGDAVSPSKRGAAKAEPVDSSSSASASSDSASSASSSDSQREPLSSSDSQERSARSSERPYLRLVR